MVKIEDLCVKYSDGNQVIDQLNMQINDGETVGIIGANGAGKSTLLMAIVGILLPYFGKIAQGSAKEILTDKSLLEESLLELPFCLQSCP